jgi:predicted RNase H-like nuclease (RuvC/YqgF family)
VKETNLNTLANEMIEDRANFKKSSEETDDKILKLEAQMSKLKEKLVEVSENLEVEKEKCEMQKIVEELRESKEESFSTAFKCCKKLKNIFTNIEGDVEAFDKVLTDRRDLCACVGARGAVPLLKKVGCDHMKLGICRVP